MNLAPSEKAPLHHFRHLVPPTNIDFMAMGMPALQISAVLNLGLDFTGGTLLEVRYSASVEIPAVRGALAQAGFGDAEAQYFGNSQEVQIRIPPREDRTTADLSTQVLAALQSVGPDAELRRVEFVGPKVGDELFEEGGLAMIYALFGILIYVGLRFEWRMALGTIVATLHDTILVLGVFALFRLTFDLTVLAAVLAVIGYSVNDSVVVLDRIRENLRKFRKATIREAINLSVNQTLSRTLMTSLTTQLAVLALLIFGGDILRNFAIALTVGIVVGSYSSVFIASAAAERLGLRREDLLPPPKEEADDAP